MFETDFTSVLIRLILSFAVGIIIGYTRERDGQSAGTRTHIVVALGATVISLIQVALTAELIEWGTANPDLATMVTVDMSRFAGQAITGISFLGAGTIIVTSNKSVKGLTTAASIWTTAAIGLAVGYGYYLIAGLATILLFVTLVLLKPIFHNSNYVLEIHFDEQRIEMKDLFKLLDKYDLRIQDIQFSDGDTFSYTFDLTTDNLSLNSVDLTQEILMNVRDVTFVNIV